MTRLCFKTAAAVLSLVAVLTSALGAQQGKADVALRAAMELETVRGDFKGAIEAYKKIVDSYRDNRPVVAQALLRMADAYQRLGSTEARKLYERIVNEYADQPVALASARQQLSMLVGGAKAGAFAEPVSRICSDCAGFEGTSLSPDGRSILLVRDSLFIARDIGSGAEKAFGAEPTGLGKPDWGVVTPVFSPDSSQIAYTALFVGTIRPQLRLMPTQPGTQHRVLVQSAEYPSIYPRAWTPDGKSVLVEIERPDKTWQLAWVSANDGAVKVLKSLDWRKAGRSNRPALSKDGKYIVYAALATNPRTAAAAAESTGMRIYVLAVDGSSESEVVDTANYYGFPVWSPDGSHIAFQSDRGSGDRQHLDLWTVPIRNGRADGTPSLVRRDVGDDRSTVLGFTPAGVLYNTSVPAGVMQVFVSEAAPSGDQNQRTRTTARFAGLGPALSPDGKSVAFLRTWGGTELIVRSLDSGEERRLPGDPKFVIAGLAWLPDGSGFLMTNQGPQPVLRRVDLRTGDVRDLFPLDTANHRLHSGFSVSPDGQTAFCIAEDLTRSQAYRSGSGSLVNVQMSTSLVKVDLATGQTRRVLDLPNPDVRFSGFAVSPNGRALALQLRSAVPDLPGREEGLTTDQVRLAIVNEDGSNYRELYGPFTQEWFGAGLAWASDDQILFTTTTADHHARVMRIHVRGGQPEFTGIDVLKSSGPGGVALSPRGPRVAYSVSPPSGRDLWAFDLSSLLTRRQ